MEGTELLVPSKLTKFKFNKKSIILVSLVAVIFILTVAAAIIFLFSGEKAYTCSIEFIYSGIESNLNPDGTTFNKQQLKSEEVLNEALASLSLTDITYEELDRHVFVQSAISGEKAKELTVTEFGRYSASPQSFYYPNKFYIVLFGADELGLSSNTAKDLLTKIADVYKSKFYSTYIEKQIQYIVTLDKSLMDYDYNEVGEVMLSRINNLKKYSDNMTGQAGFFTGLENLNFPDINSSLDNIMNVDIPLINQLAGSYYLTRDLDKLIKTYEYRIKRAKLEFRKNQLEYEETKELLSLVRKPADSETMTETSDVSAGTQYSDSTVQLAANDYYQFLVKKEADALVEYNRYEHLIDFYEKEINMYKSSGIPADEIVWAKEQIDTLIEKTDKTINDWYDTFNRISTEYSVSLMDEGLRVSDVSVTRK